MPTDIDLGPLGSRVPLFPDEPAFALAGRLALRVGAGSLRAFASDMGLSRQAIIAGHANEEVATLAKADVRNVAASTVVRTEAGYCFRGEAFQRNDWSYGALKVCPQCLTEDLSCGEAVGGLRTYVRSWWNFTFFHACPVHDVLLLACDPSDPSKVIDGRIADVRFSAGPQCDLASVKTTRGSGSKVERYVLGRLGISAPINVEMLDEIPVGHAIRLVAHVGAASVGGANAHAHRNGTVGMRDALAEGYAILCGGRSSLVELLDEILRHAGIESDHWTPRANYGYLYEWLINTTREIDSYDSIRRIVVDHVGTPVRRDAEIDADGTPILMRYRL